ncbi:hypothetical protein F0562_019911 [Nyssa sinensis]|uniref:Uncharacterized protein n=1 Tax=Nyssa sinensis TaxID=561372 RepID=A0A5J5BSY7_9ASTE|nr:hypothetical protein F0562_019911 [Nyssa sinensis]
MLISSNKFVKNTNQEDVLNFYKPYQPEEGNFLLRFIKATRTYADCSYIKGSSYKDKNDSNEDDSTDGAYSERGDDDGDDSIDGDNDEQGENEDDRTDGGNVEQGDDWQRRPGSFMGKGKETIIGRNEVGDGGQTCTASSKRPK